jgi:N-acetylmuramoyl-L-alanine amidase
MRPLLAAALLALLLQPLPALGGSADLAGRRIVLDPGHGGSDPGAVGIVQEKGINLDVALRARDLLVAEGATVLLTRDCDCAVSLADRVALANNQGAHRFISIHSNSCGGCGGTGTETYHHTSQSSSSTSGLLAKVVQEEMVQHLGLRDRGVKQADFYVLRNTNMPAVLVELGFVDTATDAAKLGSPTWRLEMARAILHATQRHFGIAPHDPGAPPPADTTPPTTTLALAGTPGNSGWHRSTVTATLAATDAGGSGLAGTWWRLDGGAWNAYAGPFPIAGQGVHALHYYSKDQAGNQEATRSATVKVDSQPPITTHVLQGIQGDEGWWRSSVAVLLQASDATSGVAWTAATLDGTPAPTPALTVTGDGIHALAWRSGDLAGNVEAWRGATVRIDATPPSTALAHGGPTHQGPDALFVSAATPFTLAATDATSGVRGSTWTWRSAAQPYAGPFALAGADGPGALAWHSTDRAGNVEVLSTIALHLDTTAPSLAIEAPPEGSVVASLEPLTITAQASDAGSGVARVEFLVDGVVRHVAAEAPYAWDWAAGDEALGEHVLEVRAVDHLGHAASVQREVTTVPTSPAGLQATAARGPPALPVVGAVVEVDPAGGGHRIGVVVDGTFIGSEA